MDKFANLKWNGQDMRFCRCPVCQEELQEISEHHIDQYEGENPVESVLSYS